MIQQMASHDCKEELNDVQLKATPARIALMKLFETSDKPLDVQTMITYLEKTHIKTDPATVFRIVNMFTQKGLTKPIQLLEGKTRYELSKGTNHHHLVCTQCGEIADIENCTIDSLQKEIEKQTQFIVKNHALEFFGICGECQKESQS